MRRRRGRAGRGRGGRRGGRRGSCRTIAGDEDAPAGEAEGVRWWTLPLQRPGQLGVRVLRAGRRRAASSRSVASRAVAQLRRRAGRGARAGAVGGRACGSRAMCLVRYLVT